MADKSDSSSAATIFYLFAGMAVFGSATPVSKIITEAFPPMTGSALRAATGALVLAPFAFSDPERFREMSRRDWVIAFFLALFGMVGFSLFMLYGMKHASGVMGSIVMSTTPAVTAIGAVVFLHESLGWRGALAIALAVAGVVLVNVLGGEGLGSAPWAGAALVFGAVCCEACFTLLGRKATQTMTPILAGFLAAAISIPLFIPLAGLEDWSRISDAPASAWAAVAWWGAGTLGLGTWLWYRGVSRASGATAAGFMGVMPISALLLSYLLLGDPFHWIHLAGFALVLIGVGLISWTHMRAAKRESGDNA